MKSAEIAKLTLEQRQKIAKRNYKRLVAMRVKRRKRQDAAMEALWAQGPAAREEMLSKEFLDRFVSPRSILQREYTARAKAKALRCEIDPNVSYLALWLDRPDKCPVCGCGMDDERDLEVNHRVPLARGGRHAMDNLEVIHHRCALKENRESKWRHIPKRTVEQIEEEEYQARRAKIFGSPPWTE